MEFYTASDEARPVRLSDDIRLWAWESEHGRYGDEAMRNPNVPMDDIPDYDALSPIKRQDLAIMRIAERAPLRLCPNEKLAGAATLGAAIKHRIPASRNGEYEFFSVSHHTPNYKRALTEGMDSYAASISARLADEALTHDQRDMLLSFENLISAMRVWHARYLRATELTSPDVHALLKRVPFAPARTFREAAQSLWFVFSFMRLMGNWPGIGRIDELLGSYLARDLESGEITLDSAREVLASFFIKGCEWIQSETPTGSGDAQHYQNIVLGGSDINGAEVTNDVTYLVLDIVEELAISDFPITVRINKNTPERLLTRAAEVAKHGGGVVAFYNEELILSALEYAGYDSRAALAFANDGCWEVQLPGETCFAYMAFDALYILNDVLGVNDSGRVPEYKSMGELYNAFLSALTKRVGSLYAERVTSAYVKDAGGWRMLSSPPCTVVSLFTDGCIENARSYFDLGPNYTVRSPHIGGAPDVGNSLYAIEQMVFVEKRMNYTELIEAIRRDWEGREAQRLYALNRYTYYGNDSDGADAWTSRVLDDFADIVHSFKSDVPVKFVPGVSTFGRQIEWASKRAATAFGARKGAILSGNDSPTPGTDYSGATAIIRSYCKANLTKQTTGAALDIKLFPSTLSGDSGVQAIASLIRGFHTLGGYFMQIDVVDAEVLRMAQEHPENFKTLSVRVSGWNARFVTLDKQWQDMIIERTAQRK